MSKNDNLHIQKKQKNDEFYTQLSDIENELKYYKCHFKDKIVLCNCDDPYESNFFKYFAMNFNSLGLKKLIATGYVASPITGTELVLPGLDVTPVPKNTPYVAYINEVPDLNGDGRKDLEDVKILLKNIHNTRRKLKGEVIHDNGGVIEYAPGDFRSHECVTLLKQADVVVTNPPFSLFREYVAQLIKYNKKFLIIGNKNAITYKEFFPLLMNNKVWIGYNQPNEFKTANGDITTKVQGLTRWFTNLDIPKRYEKLDLYKEYNPEDYPKYDNYDAINVNKVSDIPEDYDGVMGVPITYLDKHNPDQFVIVGLNAGRKEFDIYPSKKYINPIQHNKDGTVTNGSKANTRSTILIKSKDYKDAIYYTADNQKQPFTITYARIFIKRKLTVS